MLLGFAVPVVRRSAGEGPGLAEHFEHRFRPLSATVAVPVFAFMAAGVAVGGLTGFGESLSDRVAIGIVIGLLVGKPIGILAAAWLVARLTKAELDSDLTWLDVLGLSVLAGVGFTVSLLIGELAFGAGTQRDDHVKVAILLGSLLAATAAGLLLRSRNRVYDRLAEQERVDSDRDGVPDVYTARAMTGVSSAPGRPTLSASTASNPEENHFLRCARRAASVARARALFCGRHVREVSPAHRAFERPVRHPLPAGRAPNDVLLGTHLFLEETHLVLL
jgi:hypothetical protein